MSSKEVIIRDPLHGKEIFTNEAFRVDHPFRSTRQIFGPNVLDTEGAAHVKRKRIWNTAFGRKEINSEAISTTIHAGVQQGLEYAQSLNNLYVAATYIPNKIVLDLLGCHDIDPMDHYQKVRPLIHFLETGEKNSDYAQARQYVRNPMFHSKSSLFAGMSDKERESDIALLVGAGTETTVVAMKVMMGAWANDPQKFKSAIEHHGMTDFISLLLDSDPPLGMATKYCSHPVSINDIDLKKGDIVHVSIVDANRDAQCPFEKQATPGPQASQNLTFGLGRHHCPGHLLAKAELAEVALHLLDLDPARFEFKAPDYADKARPLNFRHPSDWQIQARA